MKLTAKWISAERENDVCPVFRKTWTSEKPVKAAKLCITSVGVYEAVLNGERVGEFVLAPGWTSYRKRLQVQCYDVTGQLRDTNELCVTVGKGWAISPMPGFADTPEKDRRREQKRSILAELILDYKDGTQKTIRTDGSWEWAESDIRFSEIYDGETKDASYIPANWRPVREVSLPTGNLIPQEGEEIREMERVQAKRIFTSPAGETLVDFGQEITGYVEFTVNAHRGDRVRILHGEILDGHGNFYNENYRSAKAEINYICTDGIQTWHPQLTFFGFRYIKLAEFPGKVAAAQFTAVAVYSNIRRTGYVESSDSALNQLISNVFWGQKGNFLDVPTDCPQRDERLGWTGDAQVFVKTASYNFDVERFFAKWLHDLAADQRQDGGVGQVIPDYLDGFPPSAAWGDAATICPWQIYLTYGNRKVLKEQFASMKLWVDYITNTTTTKYLWTGGTHFGDWLGLDAPSGSYKGSTREDFIASAFYARSVSLVIKAGKVLGKPVARYETLYRHILATFRKTYPDYRTQTEYVLAVWFGLSEDPQKTADALAEMIRQNGMAMQTGFVGTPYILHVLSRYGHTELAWSLLLRREYPSWLYSVGKGATTIWEHWDGIMPDGSFWSEDMNSFNHYAYGAVMDWIYEEAAGIKPVEAAPGFAEIRIEPKPDRRLQWLEASIDTRHGLVRSRWTWIGENVKYEITVPSSAVVCIGEREYRVGPGSYTFWA